MLPFTLPSIPDSSLETSLHLMISYITLSSKLIQTDLSIQSITLGSIHIWVTSNVPNPTQLLSNVSHPVPLSVKVLPFGRATGLVLLVWAHEFLLVKTETSMFF